MTLCFPVFDQPEHCEEPKVEPPSETAPRNGEVKVEKPVAGDPAQNEATSVPVLQVEVVGNSPIAPTAPPQPETLPAQNQLPNIEVEPKPKPGRTIVLYENNRLHCFNYN